MANTAAFNEALAEFLDVLQPVLNELQNNKGQEDVNAATAQLEAGTQAVKSARGIEEEPAPE